MADNPLRKYTKSPKIEAWGRCILSKRSAVFVYGKFPESWSYTLVTRSRLRSHQRQGSNSKVRASTALLTKGKTWL